MIRQLAHVCIGAKDLDATRDFYTRVLGLDLGFEFVKEGQCLGFYLHVGGRDATKSDSIVRHIYLETDDLQNNVKSIRAKGVDISEPQCGCDHTWQSWPQDPSGVPIERFEYTPESLQFKGGAVEVSW